jgi:hypothetical protein
MNRFRSGLVPLFALLALVGCNSEPTGDLRNGPEQLVATPSQLFIEVGETKTVEVGAVDAQGNPLDFNYEVTETGTGINVRRDSSFLPIFVNDSVLQAPAVGPRFRFIVEGTGYTQTSFTVSAGGLDIEIPVQVVPQLGLAATFSNEAPALGESVTLTAPAGITFVEGATVQAGEQLLTIVSQDATTITFIPPPNVNGPITVNGVVSSAAPDVVFNPATDIPLTTPLIDTVDVTYSTTTPALGQSVTMTVVEPLINIAIPATDTLAGIVFPGQLPGREPGPTGIVVAPDSNSVTFNAPPNADGSGTVVYFHFPGDYLIALPTRPNLTSTNIGTTLPAGISNNTPAVSEVVTLTAPAGFSFDPATTITLGGNAAIITSIAGDGSTISFVPFPGSAGIPQIDGVVPDAAPLNILTMPAEGDVTVPTEVPTLAGSEDPATAPAVSVPAEGALSVLFDAPDYEGPVCAATGDVCKFYEMTVTSAGLYTITMDWNVGSDIDLFLCPDPGAITGGCDFQAATGAHPEVGEYNLTPGTYYLVADDFGHDAVGTTLVITIQHDPPAPDAGLRKSAPSDLRKLQRLFK